MIMEIGFHIMQIVLGEQAKMRLFNALHGVREQFMKPGILVESLRGWMDIKSGDILTIDKAYYSNGDYFYLKLIKNGKKLSNGYPAHTFKIIG